MALGTIATTILVDLAGKGLSKLVGTLAKPAVKYIGGPVLGSIAESFAKSFIKDGNFVQRGVKWLVGKNAFLAAGKGVQKDNNAQKIVDGVGYCADIISKAVSNNEKKKPEIGFDESDKELLNRFNKLKGDSKVAPREVKETSIEELQARLNKLKFGGN